MATTIKVESQDGQVLYITRSNKNWIVSSREDFTGECLITTGEFSVQELSNKFKNYKEQYAHIEPGERD